MLNPEIIINRANCFKLLAACLYEPDKKMFGEERVIEKLQELFSSMGPAFKEVIQQLPDAFENSSEEQLKVDYAALFVGPFELLAPPYGSIYLEKGGRVHGESTVAVRKHYEQAGLSIDIQEPADHIAVELEFMYYLAIQEAQAVSSGNNKEGQKLQGMQEQFMQQFMGWVPELCERMEKHALTAYYKLLARCLSLFLLHCRNVSVTETADYST